MDESWMPCPAILRALSGRPSQEGIPFSVFSGTLTPLINHVILPLLPTPTPTHQLICKNLCHSKT